MTGRGRPRRYNREALAGVLYDALANLPESVQCEHEVRGLTSAQIADALAIPVHQVPAVTRTLRLVFADDEINVPVHTCTGRRWIYHLTGRIESGEVWMGRRLKAQIAQAEIDVAWWQSMVRANTHDRVRQRYAEQLVRSHQRILEDLQALQTPG